MYPPTVVPSFNSLDFIITKKSVKKISSEVVTEQQKDRIMEGKDKKEK